MHSVVMANGIPGRPHEEGVLGGAGSLAGKFEGY